MYFIIKSSLGNQNRSTLRLHPNLMQPHMAGIFAALEVS